MQTLMLKTRADKDGFIRLEIPTNNIDQAFEIVLVLHQIDDLPHTSDALDAMGYPIGYFDETYGSMTDDPIERNQPLHPDVRDEML